MIGIGKGVRRAALLAALLVLGKGSAAAPPARTPEAFYKGCEVGAVPPVRRR